MSLDKKFPIKPITPSEAVAARVEAMPDKVIEVWNRLIVKHLDASGRAKVSQEDAVGALLNALDVTRAYVFESGWLDIEKLYSDAGWVVLHEKPSIGDTFKPYFEFRAIRTLRAAE